MKIKIISSNDKDNWYTNKIGQVYDVKGIPVTSPDKSFLRYDLYQVIDEYSLNYYIYKTDCKLISEIRNESIDSILNNETFGE